MTKVSIQLVTWNGAKYIEECLNSILEQTFKDFLLVIVDNGSVDQTLLIIEQQYLPVFGEKLRLVKNKENLGFARAHNQALLWTESEYVVILNQDVILAENFLQQLVDFLDENKTVGSLSGKLLRWQFESDGIIKESKKTDIIDSIGLKIFKSHRVVEMGGGEKDIGQYENNIEIFGPSAACPIYRRQALNDICYKKEEYFDNDFFSYKEDVDLAYRLQWRGWKSFYLPTAVAYHARTAKSQEQAANMEIIKLRKNKTDFVNYHSYKNHLFLLEKNLSFKNFIHCFFNIFFYELKKFLYILIFEWSTLSGLKGFFGKHKAMKAKRRFIMLQRLVKDEEMRKWFA